VTSNSSGCSNRSDANKSRDASNSMQSRQQKQECHYQKKCNQKGASATVPATESNDKKTINSDEENNCRTPRMQTAAKALQQQGRQQ
jgi:hypothetical protein